MSKGQLVVFIPSLGDVRRPCRGLEKYCPPVLQRFYGCRCFHKKDGVPVVAFFFFFLDLEDRGVVFLLFIEKKKTIISERVTCYERI